MSVPIFTIRQSNPAMAAAKKKRVLLVDTSRAKRDLRSETMRRLGAEVDCAADVTEARCWWRADLYDLVLMHVDTAQAPTDKFCDDIRRVMPHQQIMFLVGKPEYLAASPNVDQALSVREQEIEVALYDEVRIPLAASNGSGPAEQRWGILEACRRISEVRSALEARSRAMRDRPFPTRDPEAHHRNGKNGSDALAELIREEIAEGIQ
jgi:CheY-like chemotaxis protein